MSDLGIAVALTTLPFGESYWVKGDLEVTRVLGGWIYRHHSNVNVYDDRGSYVNCYPTVTAMIFVPDPPKEAP